MAKQPILRHAPCAHRGFTLTEVTIVLGIVGLILGAIWVAAVSVRTNNDSNFAATELQTVSQNMLSLYSGRGFPTSCVGGGSTDITGNAISAGVVPTVDVVSTGVCGKANQAWAPVGQSFVISTVTANSFRLSFYNVPLEGCIDLILRATSCDPNQSGCPIKVWAKGSYGHAPTASATPAAGPPKTWAGSLDPTGAKNLCLNNSGATNSVEFDFNL